uniref:RFTS domain-containing protein n=1 Tax=Arundo donax TaxID=35708 RepID=A0A0A9GGP7_ARUDO
MFDDDDGVEPQFKVVDEYYFEYSKYEPVCFSILPFQFDGNEEVTDCASEKKVYLRGVLDRSHYPVHRKVVAWRVELDCEKPNILVLSSESNWITLLKPCKCYREEIARSILITIQILHFVRKQPRDKRRLWGRFWDHLYEVFDKLDIKPLVDDLRKHRPLIKLFVERDPVLMKSKMLSRFIEDTTRKIKEPKTTSNKMQFIVSGESRTSNSSNDGDYGDRWQA